MDPHPVEVDPAVAGSQLLDGIFLVFKTIIPQVSVAIVVIPLRTVGMASAVAYGDDDKTQLGKTVCAGKALAPFDVVGFYLGARIYIVADGIDLGGVEVERLVDGSIKVGEAVCGFET